MKCYICKKEVKAEEVVAVSLTNDPQSKSVPCCPDHVGVKPKTN